MMKVVMENKTGNMEKEEKCQRRGYPRSLNGTPCGPNDRSRIKQLPYFRAGFHNMLAYTEKFKNMTRTWISSYCHWPYREKSGACGESHNEEPLER